MWIVPSGALFFLTRPNAPDRLILEMLFNLWELTFRNGTVCLSFLDEMYLSQVFTNDVSIYFLKVLARTTAKDACKASKGITWLAELNRKLVYY